MAIIADVHTDLNSGNVLEVAVGKPLYLYVVAPVEGRLQLCRGGMFSYYEFAHPMNDRLTDEKWQGMLAQHIAPLPPAWTHTFAIDSAQSNSYRASDEYSILYKSVTIGNTFRSGDSVIALVSSDSIPSVTVESAGSPQQIFGAIASGNTYRIAIPPQAFTDSLVVLTFQQYFIDRSMDCREIEPLSYRKLLMRDGPVAVINKTIDFATLSVPRVRGNHVQLPPATSWRVLTMQGKQIAAIALGTREWIAPKWLTQTPLLMAPVGKKGSAPIRVLMIH